MQLAAIIVGCLVCLTACGSAAPDPAAAPATDVESTASEYSSFGTLELIELLAAAMAEDQQADWARPEFWREAPVRGERTAAIEDELLTRGPAAIPGLLEHIDDSRLAGFNEFMRLGAYTTLAGTMSESRTPDDLAAGRGKNLIRENRRPGMETWQEKLAVRLGEQAMSGEALDRGEMPGVWVYPMRIGDLCIVILGRIVNRHYRFIRFIDAGKDIGYTRSPVYQAWLAAGLREEWGGDSRAKLLHSLHLDLTGVSGLESHYINVDAVEAAKRIKRYFPEQFEALVQQARAASGKWFHPEGYEIAALREPVLHAAQSLTDSE